jgi:hypothetical protein
MTSKELRKQVEDKIYEGKSYQAVFDELLALYPNRERDLARVIADVPSLAQRRKLLWMNILLIVCICLNVLVKLFSAFVEAQDEALIFLILNLIFPTLNVVFLFMIAFWKPIAYHPVAGLACVSIIWNAFYLIASSSRAYESFVYIFMAGYLAILLLIAILGFYLGQNVGGSYKIGHQTYKDASGQVRKRQVVKWLN